MNPFDHAILAFSSVTDSWAPLDDFDSVITTVALVRVQSEMQRHNQRGVRLQAQKKLHAAIAEYDRALALNPHFP
jgi:hypothetical protein